MKSNSLVFFKGVSDEDLEKPFVLSSLQDFEGALLLVSDQRWPASLMMLWSSCEKMIKAAICNSEGDVSRVRLQQLQDLAAWELQQHFKTLNSSLSESLNTKGHSLRKLRNEIAHKGSSPEDDYSCIHLFFRGGVSYFEACLSFTLGTKMQNAMGKEGAWYWDIYKKTRKGVCKFVDGSISPEMREGMFYLSQASRKCLMINMPNQCCHPTFGFLSDYIQDGKHSDIEDEARRAAYSKVKSDFEAEGWEVCPAYVSPDDDKSGLLSEVMSFSCPVCGGGEGIIGFECKDLGENKWEFEHLKGYCCLDDLCLLSGIPFYALTFLEVFFENALTDEVKRFLGEEGGACESPFEG